MFSLDLMIVAALVNLFNEIVDSLWCVLYAKRFSKNISISVAEHDGVLFFGIVHCHDKDLLAGRRLFKDAHQVLTLLLKYGSFFHVKFLSNFATRAHGSHGNPRWLFNVPRASCPMAITNKIGTSHFICKAPKVSEGNVSRASLKARSHPLHETLGWYQTWK